MKKKRLNELVTQITLGTTTRLMIKEGPQSWVLVGHQKSTFLDKYELTRCQLLNKNQDKVLAVKLKKLQGKTPTEIHKETGISRSTIDNYMASVFSKSTLNTIHIIHSKSNQNTAVSNLVLFIFLNANNLNGQNTFWIAGLLIGLLLLFLLSYIWREKENKEQQKFQACQSKYYTLFTEAVRLMHRRELIVAPNKKKGAYYRKLLTHYNNKKRSVVVLTIEREEDLGQYRTRAESYQRQYALNNMHLLKKGREDYTNQMNEYRAEGKMDWFKGDYYNEASLVFIENLIAPLLDPDTFDSNTKEDKEEVAIVLENT